MPANVKNSPFSHWMAWHPCQEIFDINIKKKQIHSMNVNIFFFETESYYVALVDKKDAT